MEFSPDQTAAINSAVEWHKSKAQPVFRLEGSAGTGKSSVAGEISRLVGGDVLFCAPTGKATQVLQRKGNTGAMTVHRAIYKPSDELQAEIDKLKEELKECNDSRREQQIRREIKELRTKPTFVLADKEKAFGGRKPNMIILDESSMVNDDMMQDLCSFGFPILALGDPAQLPPVGGAARWSAGTPDALLTTIHRGSGVDDLIDLSILMREGKRAPRWNGTAGRSFKQWSPKDIAHFDQIICGTNKMRWNLTNEIRSERGYPQGVPVAGDKILCIKNNQASGAVNGQQATVLSIKLVEDNTAYEIEVESYGEKATWVTDKRGFLDQEGQTEVKGDRSGTKIAATFGWVITCHASQGSQFKDVCVVNESYVFRDDAARWAYTAATRAEERCLLVDPGNLI